MTALLVTSEMGCLGVFRVPSYSLRRRSPVLLGFPGLSRPVGFDLAPIGFGMCRLMPRANGYGHVAFPLRRDPAETSLVRRASQKGLAGSG